MSNVGGGGGGGGLGQVASPVVKSSDYCSLLLRKVDMFLEILNRLATILMR